MSESVIEEIGLLGVIPSHPPYGNMIGEEPGFFLSDVAVGKQLWEDTMNFLLSGNNALDSIYMYMQSCGSPGDLPGNSPLVTCKQ